MIQLHQYPAAWGLSSLSPFCIKVELFLKMANLPYQTVTELFPQKGPKGKMPFIEDEQEKIPDSSDILEHLKSKHHLDELFPLEGSKEAAITHAFQKMVEENLYFIILYSRWVDKENSASTIDLFSELFPFWMGKPVLRFIRRTLIWQANAQGVGRHSKEEVYGRGLKDLGAIEAHLGKQQYFMGEKIKAVDTTIFSFLKTIVSTPFETPLKIKIMESSTLTQYLERIETQFF